MKDLKKKSLEANGPKCSKVKFKTEDPSQLKWLKSEEQEELTYKSSIYTFSNASAPISKYSRVWMHIWVPFGKTFLRELQFNKQS